MTTGLLLAALCSIAPTLALASTVPSNRGRIVYTSPQPDARFVRPQTSLIFRFDHPLAAGGPAISVTATGTRSGVHAGVARIADDGRTLLFQPEAPFTWGERVHVALAAPEGPLADPRAALDFAIAAGPAPAPPASAEPAEDPMRPLTEMRAPSAPSALDGIATGPPVLIPVLLGTPAPGRLFFSMYTWNGALAPYMMILENSGTPYFMRQLATTDFKVQPNGLLTYFDLGTTKFYALDSTYAVVDSFQCTSGYETDAHELLLLPNGHALLLGIDRQIVDMSEIVPGGYPEVTVLGQVIQELDAQKQVVFEWRSWDHFEITDATHENLNAAYIDYVHANALEVEPDGSLLMSSRHMDEVTKIDRETGAIVWRWGGRHNQFTFVGDTTKFSHQHAIRRLENGRYMLFDNGNYSVPRVSRAVEYVLDQDAMTAERVWQYRTVPDTYGAAMGSAQRLPNGSTLICWGTGQPEITEVSADGEVVMELILPGAYMTYRAFRQEWPPVQTTSATDGPRAPVVTASVRNPFRERTDLFLGLPSASSVSVRLFDTQGRLVNKVLDAAPYGAGLYRIRLDLTGSAAGVYFCRVTTDDGEVTRRLVNLN